MGIFTYLLIPETKNTPIEDIEYRWVLIKATNS
jgi:hypothetical protein